MILARWLASDPRLLILDEPTRGIDVGAKAEIQKLILGLAREGCRSCSSHPSWKRSWCSSRVAVMRDRRKIAELSGKEVTQDRIIEAIAGTGGTMTTIARLRRAARRPRRGW